MYTTLTDIQARSKRWKGAGKGGDIKDRKKQKQSNGENTFRRFLNETPTERDSLHERMDKTEAERGKPNLQEWAGETRLAWVPVERA